ncbi:MAG: alpha/beta hydrolase [Winogradskyella sp.]|uniref:alpha/beta fold hydrolase n=1 Tax=Winogradskyella sp. TaxID=1883156 RepID=UPI000F4063DA|nr:alpha/beta hydrolase [Winogradskyella sp.]RNC86385.1 MAG: alpha/beta hydrolase [Winogradskyella sp.]
MKKIAFLIVITFVSFQVDANTTEAIHVEVKGSGEPILLIPGFTVPGSIWNPLVENLKNRYECHIITLAGFDNKAPIEFPWLPKVNQSIEDYINNNNLEHLTVIGHSLGGTIATWLASRDNTKVSKIIVVDGLPAAGALMIPNFNPDNLVYNSPYNNQQLAMDKSEFEHMATTMSKNMSTNEQAQEKIKQWIVKADRKTYVYGYTDYLKLDMRDDLNKITIPVTIIAATNPYGKAMVTQTYKSQYSNLKEYNLIFAEDAAHFIMLDKPKWFIEQINEILSLQE